MSAHAAVFHCPYCGDEALVPHEESHGAWHCSSCARIFSVKFIGLSRADLNRADVGQTEFRPADVQPTATDGSQP